jgi:hypothetical protein
MLTTFILESNNNCQHQAYLFVVSDPIKLDELLLHGLAFEVFLALGVERKLLVVKANELINIRAG